MKKMHWFGASLVCFSLAAVGCVEPQGAGPQATTTNKPAISDEEVADDDPLATETQDRQDSEAMTDEDTEEMKNSGANEGGAMNSGAMNDSAIDNATDAGPENQQ